MLGPRHWIDNHPVEVKPAVSVGHEALQQPGKVSIPASSTGSKVIVGGVPDCSIAQLPASIQPPLTQNPSPAAPYYSQAAPVAAAPSAAPSMVTSRPVTAWSGAVVKNAAAAAAATLPVFTPDDFPAALSTKSTPATAPAPPKTALSYASMVGRPPSISQPSRSIASVGSGADMTSEHRRCDSSRSPFKTSSSSPFCSIFFSQLLALSLHVL